MSLQRLSSQPVLAHRFARMVGAVMVGRGLLAARQVILVPILLHAWGVEYYGHWLMVSAIPVFLSMSNLGIGTSAANRIAIDLAMGKTTQARFVLRLSTKAILSVGAIISAAIFGVFAIFFDDQFALPLGRVDVILALLCMAAFIQMAGAPRIGWWVGLERPSTGYNFQNYLSLAVFLATALVPLSGGGAVATAAIISMVTLVWFVVLCAKTPVTPRSPTGAGGLSRTSCLRDLLKIGLGHQLSSLWQALYFQGSLLLAGSLMGPGGAALWGALRAVSRAGNQGLEVVSQSLAPEFQLAYTRKDYRRLRRLHALGLLASVILASALAIALLLFGQPIFHVWTAGKLSTPFLPLAILAMSLLPFSLWWVSSEVQRSLNFPWYLNVLAVTFALVALTAMVALPKGITSFAVGALTFDLLMSIFVLPRTMRLLNSSSSEVRQDLVHAAAEVRTCLIRAMRHR